MLNDSGRRQVALKLLAMVFVSGIFVSRVGAQSPVAVPSMAALRASSVDARALGIAESTLNYCARVDSTSAAALRAQVQALLRGASAAAVVLTRKTGEYRMAYDSVTDFVGKVDDHNVHLVCSRRAKAN